jgi:hypothetical protein
MPDPACPHVTRAAELWIMNPHWMGRKAGATAFENKIFIPRSKRSFTEAEEEQIEGIA